jgi:hypothetical protein
MSRNLCNCPNCQTQDCPAGVEVTRLEAERDEARAVLREAIDYIYGGKCRDWKAIIARWRTVAGMENAEHHARPEAKRKDVA